jgi:hypothetical protein
MTATTLWELSDGTKAPPATAATLISWEATTGYRIPSLLRDALLLQNGGVVKDTDPALTVNSIEEWEAVEPYTLLLDDENQAGTISSQLIRFATDSHGVDYVLDYRKVDAQKEPLAQELPQFEQIADSTESVTVLLTRLCATTVEPEVEGCHARFLTRIGQTTIKGSDHTSSIILGRDIDGLLVLMEHFTGPEDLRWSATLLPEPLNAGASGISTSTWFGTECYELTLTPSDANGIVSVDCTRLPSGRWKNRRTDGTPVYLTIHSESLATLEKIRQDLIPSGLSPLRIEADRLKSEYLRRLSTWPTDKKKAAEFYKIRLEGEAALDGFSSQLEDDEDFLKGSVGMMQQISGFGTRVLELGASAIGLGCSSLPADMQDLIRRLVTTEAAAENEEHAH